GKSPRILEGCHRSMTRRPRRPCDTEVALKRLRLEFLAAILLFVLPGVPHGAQIDSLATRSVAPPLSPEPRRQLVEAARDQELTPWQRKLMLEVSGQSPKPGTVVPPAIHMGANDNRVASASDGHWEYKSQLERYGHTATYDPTGARVVVIGGLGVGG